LLHLFVKYLSYVSFPCNFQKKLFLLSSLVIPLEGLKNNGMNRLLAHTNDVNLLGKLIDTLKNVNLP
jgi:hypothetical protein